MTATSSAADQPGRCKGSLLVHLRRFVTERHGAALWDTIQSALPDADREVLGGLLLAGGWYPVGIWSRALRGYLERVAPLERDRQKRMAELSGFIAAEDLSTVFKVLLRIATPSMVAARTPALWARYFDVGTMIPKEREERRWEVALEAPLGEDQAPDELTCKYGVPGWLSRALSIAGATPQVSQTACRFQGAPRCLYELRW